MAPFFRSRRTAVAEDAVGSGGKLLRGRRREPPASPYPRPKGPSPSTPAPSPLLLPAPAPPAGSRLLGLISGAGKLISSVFRSDESSSPSASSSASGYSSEEENVGRGEKEVNDVSNRAQRLYQGEKTPDLLNFEDRSKAIILMSESKLAIEQLLMQETFTRDELIRLTKLMQSRVVDSPSLEMSQKRAESEMLMRNDDSAIASSIGWEPLNQKRELVETVPYCHSKLNSLSPTFHSPLACAPGNHSEAVMEAKKWLDNRKLESNSNSNNVCGPCVLNTDMLNPDLFNGAGSPVNLARSYMRSLPPWHSPPSRKGSLFKDENTNENGSSSLPSFKVFKRRYLSSISVDSPVETRKVCMRSTESVPESPKLKGTGSDKMFEKETLKVSSSPDQIIGKALGAYHDSSSVKAVEIPDTSNNLNLEHVDDQHSTETLKLSDEKTVNAIPPTINKDNSTILASEPAAKAVELSYGSVLPVVNSLEATDAKLETASILDVKKLDPIKPSNTEHCCAIISTCHESVGFASSSMTYNGNPLYKTEVETAKGNKIIKQSANDDVQASNMLRTIGEVTGTLEAKNTTELNLNSGTKPHDDDRSLKGEINGRVNKPSTNGSFAESNAKFKLKSADKDNPSSGYSGLSEGSSKLPTESVEKPAVRETEITKGKSKSGMKMKSIERMLTPEPHRGATRYARKTVVNKMKTGKGRGGKSTSS